MLTSYKQACSSYLETYIKIEDRGEKKHSGWYHYIDDPSFTTVGIVATAQMLILIKNNSLPVSFDCNPMVLSLIDMQNEDGGWSYRSNIDENSCTEPTALAIQAIMLWRECGLEKSLAAVSKGVAWLIDVRNEKGLWGPIGKHETEGYTYFTCSVLQCLNHVLIEKITDFCYPIEEIIRQCCNSLLSSFNDRNPGWGEKETALPTLFHTAYVCFTLSSVDNAFHSNHKFIKSISAIEKSLRVDELTSFSTDGKHEIYQFGARRLNYTHSVDIYSTLAVLYYYYNSKQRIPNAIEEKCNAFLCSAQSTDWSYDGFVTSWRLYDITKCSQIYEKCKQREYTVMNHYKVALTFPGETRALVEKIADILSNRYGKGSILYDKYHEAEFARPNLDSYLQDLYHDHSDLIVVFLCEQYASKRWCGIEWKSIRDVLNKMNYEKIMYIKAFDGDIETISLPGFYPSEDGYIDANVHSPEELADLIISRL